MYGSFGVVISTATLEAAPPEASSPGTAVDNDTYSGGLSVAECSNNLQLLISGLL